jgi:tetratricopeptide (TPR) repeat protein
MKGWRLFSILSIIGVAILLLSYACDSPLAPQEKSSSDSSLYLNHSDTARYVGMNTCRQCHANIYETFIKTGMGKSFDLATKTKSSGDFKKSVLFDRYSDFYYRAFWQKDSLFFYEYRLLGKDTIHKRLEQVNYIIGSGQHTNSHLQSTNGYLHQMPMTYYTQSKRWDLPPGFENGINTRFSRKIGLECMSCHNAYPDFVAGSENKFSHLPQGIDCERCHGPGSIHAAQRQSQERIDTSKYIDYSIVNPSKLPLERQFDICQRCHLQGNAVLKEGHSFFDFKPGQTLSDHISVFLPRYKNADDEFIMASHADRLKQSACFIKSLNNAAGNNALRPYKGAMTCITCHNPHVSVKETNPNVFNEACLNCHHKSEMPLKHNAMADKTIQNCVSCHMPASGSTDIPHVSVHDHYIRKPITKKEKDKIKQFLGLKSINEKKPDVLTMANAYIDQFEKFEQKSEYLDSARFYLRQIKDVNLKFHAQVHLEFASKAPANILKVLAEVGEENAFQHLVTKTALDNRHAWSAYRIAEAFSAIGQNAKALRWMQKASVLAPYNLEFRSKLGTLLAGTDDIAGAMAAYQFVLKEYPKHVQALTNLGYLYLVQGNAVEALRLYKIGYALEPDNASLLLNLAGYYLYKNDRANAEVYLKQVLKRDPSNEKARQVLEQIKKSHV